MEHLRYFEANIQRDGITLAFRDYGGMEDALFAFTEAPPLPLS